MWGFAEIYRPGLLGVGIRMEEQLMDGIFIHSLSLRRGNNKKNLNIKKVAVKALGA